MAKATPLQIPPSDQVRAMVRASGITQRHLADLCGFSSHSTITAFLAGKSITTSNLDRIFSAVQEYSKNSDCRK